MLVCLSYSYAYGNFGKLGHKGFPEGITKCYKLYLKQVQASNEAAYTLLSGA